MLDFITSWFGCCADCLESATGVFESDVRAERVTVVFIAGFANSASFVVFLDESGYARVACVYYSSYVTRSA